MRNRTIQLNIRLTKSEHDKLTRNSKKAGLTTSGYIRMLINGYIPKEAPPIEYHEFMKQLTQFANKSCNDNSELHQVILNLQETVTQPENTECVK